MYTIKNKLQELAHELYIILVNREFVISAHLNPFLSQENETEFFVRDEKSFTKYQYVFCDKYLQILII